MRKARFACTASTIANTGDAIIYRLRLMIEMKVRAVKQRLRRVNTMAQGRSRQHGSISYALWRFAELYQVSAAMSRIIAAYVTL